MGHSKSEAGGAGGGGASLFVRWIPDSKNMPIAFMAKFSSHPIYDILQIKN